MKDAVKNNTLPQALRLTNQQNKGKTCPKFTLCN